MINDQTKKDRKENEIEVLCQQGNNVILADLIRLGYRVYGNTKTEETMIRELESAEIQSEKIQLLIKVIKKHRTFINQELYQHNAAFGFVSYPHYTDLKWRLDIVISNSQLKKVWQPQLSLRF
ncbi:hypothetical protein RFI_00863 [Reticulomyxa filosa]|uniref:COMM domain-containing protein n=1 Tax=Reticulomyxa filosa TaxID=46433 RepID=X6PET8_RETFI|nr:hypothetical protein RFI_00863 [Reticulomyxa filosa]|eukprot:ETO36197.1 hypothetical protein RFI_00863 [Reticulomyxa filosa]